MSQDLFLGIVKKDWSRGSSRLTVAEPPAAEPLTEADRERLAKLAVLKMKASSGDRLAKLQWKKIKVNVAILKVKARKGDPKAKHDLAVLDDSGLLGHVQTISGAAGATDAELEMLMNKSLTDDQLDHIMTRVVQDDAIIDALRILQKRPDHGTVLKNRIKLRASGGHLDARKIAGAMELHDRAVAGDPAAKRALVDWCSTSSHSSRSSGSFVGSSDAELGTFVGSDELELARDGGACERAALARTSGIVISDREIKDAMRGSLSLVGGRRRHHHRHHHRKIFPSFSQSQAPGQPASTYDPGRDAQKSQIVRSLYRQIKNEHINWMTNLDHQNNVWNQTPDRYQQAGRAWARSQLQQQQLPTRLTPAGTNPWVQPVSWFQSQAQAVLNASAGQRSATIDASLQDPANPYPLQSSYASASIPMASSTSNTYYPAPGGTSSDNPSLYDDDQEGDSFVGDEERAQGEDSGKWHWGSPFRKIGRGFKKVGRGFERGLKTTGLVAVDALKSAPMALSQGDFVGEALSHNEYRALVLDQAIKKAGGNRPGTKHLFAAKKAVDGALGRSGTSIYIPGAGPARRTV